MSKNTAPQLSFDRYDKVTVDRVDSFNVNALANGNILLLKQDYRYVSSSVTYNSKGSVNSSVPFNDKSYPVAFGDMLGGISIQSDGKVLVAYNYDKYNPVGPNQYNFSLMRYNANGFLDTRFSGDGQVFSDLGSDSAHAIALQADKKILVAGERGSDFFLVRYNANGTLDTSFSGDGKVITTSGLLSGGSANPDQDSANAVTVQANGKILVAGSTVADGTNNSNFALLRYNTNGSLDTGFSDDGKVITDLGFSTDIADKVTLQADGKILVTGASNGKFALVRYHTDGALDTGFSGDGKLLSSLVTSRNHQTVSMLADGKILLAGIGSNGKFALERYNSNGSLDNSFSGDGKISTNTPVSAVSTQADGKILLVSTSYLLRYTQDGRLDTTFGHTDSVAVYGQNAAAVVLNKGIHVFDAELSARGNYSGASVGLVRHGGANSQDMFSGSGKLSFHADKMVLSGITIGTVSNHAGKLALTFNNNANQVRINEALSSIAYKNTDLHHTSALVAIDWTFNDGNAGMQGTGGALTSLGATHVYLNPAPLHKPAAIHYTDTKFYDNFPAVTGSLAVGPAKPGIISYGIKGFQSSDNTSTVTADNGYGLLEVNKTTGAYILFPSKDVIESLATNKTAGFMVTISYGTHVFDSKILAINITQAGKTESAGNDTLVGTPGNDVINAQEGDNKITGNAGNDILRAGNGDDIIYGGDGNDTIDGRGGHNTLYGNDGNDTITASNGFFDNTNTVMYGGNGNDILYASGGNGSVLYGDNGNDILHGANSGEALIGGNGDDTLYTNGSGSRKTGFGLDVLTGGAGKDTFVPTQLFEEVRITDFKPIDDTIVLTGIYDTRVLGVLNVNNFVIGSKAIDSNDYIIYDKSTGDLFYDSNGSEPGIPEELIATLGVNLPITHADFVVV
jgi:uncharacterized delta-60 repeat protein